MTNNYLKVTARAEDKTIIREYFIFFDDTDDTTQRAAIMRAIDLMPDDPNRIGVGCMSVFRRLAAHPSIPVIGDFAAG